MHLHDLLKRTLAEATEAYSASANLASQAKVPDSAAELVTCADTAPLAYAAAGNWGAVVDALEDGARPSQAPPLVGHPAVHSRRAKLYQGEEKTFNSSMLLDMAAAAGERLAVCYILARYNMLNVSFVALEMAPAVLAAHSTTDSGLAALDAIKVVARLDCDSETASRVCARALKYLIDMAIAKNDIELLKTIWKHYKLNWERSAVWQSMLRGPLQAEAPSPLISGSSAGAILRKATSTAAGSEAADLISLARSNNWGAFYNLAEDNAALVKRLHESQVTDNHGTVADVAAAHAVKTNNDVALAYILWRTHALASEMAIAPLAVQAAECGNFELALSLLAHISKPNAESRHAALAVSAHAIYSKQFVVFVRAVQYALVDKRAAYDDLTADIIAIFVLCTRRGHGIMAQTILMDLINGKMPNSGLKSFYEAIEPAVHKAARAYLCIPPNLREDRFAHDTTVLLYACIQSEPAFTSEWEAKKHRNDFSNLMDKWSNDLCPCCGPTEPHLVRADYIARYIDEIVCTALPEHISEMLEMAVNKPPIDLHLMQWVEHACVHSHIPDMIDALFDLTPRVAPETSRNAFNLAFSMLFSGEKGADAAMLLQSALRNPWAPDLYAEACVALAQSSRASSFAERFRMIARRLDDGMFAKIVPRLFDALKKRLVIETHGNNPFLAHMANADPRGGASLPADIAKGRSDVTMIALNILEAASARSEDIRKLALRSASQVASAHTVIEVQGAFAPLVDDARFELFSALLADLALDESNDATLARNWAVREDALAAAFQRRLDWEASTLLAVSADVSEFADDAICVVCRDPLAGLVPESGAEISGHVVSIGCKGRHVFHRACILAWLSCKPLCPVCKHVFELPPGA